MKRHALHPPIRFRTIAPNHKDNTVAFSSTRSIPTVADVRTLHTVVDPDVAPPELTLWREGRLDRLKYGARTAPAAASPWALFPRRYWRKRRRNAPRRTRRMRASRSWRKTLRPVRCRRKRNSIACRCKSCRVRRRLSTHGRSGDRRISRVGLHSFGFLDLEKSRTTSCRRLASILTNGDVPDTFRF
jgi:hypothetical protein